MYNYFKLLGRGYPVRKFDKVRVLIFGNLKMDCNGAGSRSAFDTFFFQKDQSKQEMGTGFILSD